MKKQRLITVALLMLALSLLLLIATGCIECDHSGGTATCTSQAFCELCDTPYGDVDFSNHTGELVWGKDIGHT
jgi:hypothetical protein